MAKDKKPKSASVADYMLAKNGTTKYIKFQCSPKASTAIKKLVKDVIAALGTDVLFVNLMDQDFKNKYEIPDFVKGRLSIPVDEDGNPISSSSEEPEAPAKSKKSSKADDDGGVNF
jgi:hypothetical protein